MINFYQNKTLKDTVQSQVISQQLFEQVMSVPLQLSLVQILHSLILMHDIWTKNSEKLLLVPKADCRKVRIKFMLYHTLLEFYKKMTLNMSKYELGHYLSSVTIKSVKKTMSLRPFMQVTKVLSP